MQVHDEIPHLRVVDGLLRLGPPRRIGGGIVRIDADNIDFTEILEFDVIEAREFAAKSGIVLVQEEDLARLLL